MTAQQPEDRVTFARQLDILFEVIKSPSGKPYYNQDLCDASGLSSGTISRFRNGTLTNPTLTTLIGICEFFGISLDYFQSSTIEQCYAYLDANEHKVREITNFLRSKGLSERGVRLVIDTIAYMQDNESRRSQLPYVQPRRMSG